MPSTFFVDPASIDLDRMEYTIEQIREYIPQRYEFEQLTSILSFRPEEKIVVGLREVRHDEFWVRGHIPGRPLFPGVLMIEAAAQLCSFYSGKTVGHEHFFGFGGIDGARFRGTVEPGDKLVLLASPRTLKKSGSLFDTQGIVGGKLVFEATILGVRIS